MAIVRTIQRPVMTDEDIGTAANRPLDTSPCLTSSSPNRGVVRACRFLRGMNMFGATYDDVAIWGIGDDIR